MSPKPAEPFHTSMLSRYCARYLGPDFTYMDGDHVLFQKSALPIVYARETGVLRILEWKGPGDEVRRSQREIFPLLAAITKLGVEAGLLRSGSGAFVLQGDMRLDPDRRLDVLPERVKISEVRAARHARDWSAIGIQFERVRERDRAELDSFLRCRPIQRIAA